MNDYSDYWNKEINKQTTRQIDKLNEKYNKQKEKECATFWRLVVILAAECAIKVTH